MTRQTIRKKWLSGILAAGLLLTAYTPVSLAAETNQTQANSISSVPRYEDVPDQAWYAKSVNGWITLGILRPQQGEKFQPNFVTTRGDFAFLLAYSLGLTPSSKPTVFMDLSGHELAGYITALQETGLAKGYPDNTFRPNAPVTRAEAARWIATARKLQSGSQTSKLLFRDVSPDSWYSGAVEALVKAGIISGKSKDRFAPTDSISRAETIAMLDRSFFSPSLIQDIRADGMIMIDGLAYHADESLRGIFQLSNKAILHNAAIQFTADGNKIVSVEYLMIGYKGALAGEDEPLVLNAGGNAINGIVMVDADHITLANLEVKGDLILSRGFQSDFLAYRVNVKGQTVYLEDFGRTKEQITNLEFQDSDLGKVVLGNSVNVREVNVDPDKLSKTSIKPTKVIRFLAGPEPTRKSSVPTATPKLPALGVPIIPPGTQKPQIGPPSLPPGLHLQVTDGAIILTNSGGSLGFQAGQFGYVPNVMVPPIVVPPNPGMQFVPPPVFNGNAGANIGEPPSGKEVRPPIDGKKVICENVNCNVEALVNTQIKIGGTGTISGIIVHSGADAEYIGEKPIQKLVLGDPNSPRGVSFTGSANIENVTVNDTNGSITLNSKGTIGNLIVPPRMDPKSLFTNPGDLNKVAEIGGVRTASYCSLVPSDPICQVSSPPASTPEPDHTPILNSIVTETVTADSAQFMITSTNAAILYYVLLPSGEAAPSASQVKDGHMGSQTFLGGESHIFLPQLNVNTTYTLYVAGYSDLGGLSAVKLMNFTTLDSTPSVSDVVYSVISEQDNTVNFVATFENASMLYYVVVNDAPVPTADAVKNGTAKGTILSGSFVVTNSTNQSFPVTLPNPWEYTIYIVAEIGGRMSNVLGKDFRAADLDSPVLR